MLLPQGVSSAIKRRAGHQPFRELARLGPIPLGEAVLTSAGQLPFQAIIHVAGINLLWRSSEQSVRNSVQNAMKLVIKHRFQSVAFPLIGAGSGGTKKDLVSQWMRDELERIEFDGVVRVVEFTSLTA